MFRINVWHIVRDHFKSLWLEYDGEIKEGLYWGDKFLFFIVPIGLSITLIYYGIDLKPQVGNLIKVLAFFGAFLFNLLAVIHGQLGRIKEDAQKIEDEEAKKQKIKFAREIHSNITFSMLLAIVLILFMLIYDLTPLNDNCPNLVDITNWNKNCINLVIIKTTLFLNYTLLILFGLTLLMVINRVYILVRQESES